MRKDFATRKTFSSVRCFRLSSCRAEALDALVLMMAGFLLVGWILGHLLLSLYPPTASALESRSSTADRLASLSGDESNGGSGEVGAASGTDPTDDPNAKSEDTLATNDDFQVAEIQKHLDREGELESEVDSLKTANEQLLAENSSLKNASATSPSSTDETEVDKLRDDLQSANEQLSAAEKNALAVNQQLEKSETSYQELQTRLNDVQSALKQTESDLAIAKTEQKTATEIDVSSPFADMPGEKENDAANDALIEEVKQAEAKVGKLETRISSLEEELKSTADRVTAREQELRSAKLASEKLKLAAEQLKTRNDELADQARKCCESAAGN